MSAGVGRGNTDDAEADPPFAELLAPLLALVEAGREGRGDAAPVGRGRVGSKGRRPAAETTGAQGADAEPGSTAGFEAATVLSLVTELLSLLA